MHDPETVAREFCTAFARRDVDELLAYAAWRDYLDFATGQRQTS